MEALLPVLAPLALLAVVYAVVFGWRPPALARGAGDRAYLDGDLGARSGLAGAFVAAATAAHVAGGAASIRPGTYPLVALLAVLVACDSRALRELVYALLGMIAAGLTLVGLLAGDCGQALPSVVSGVVATLPALLVGLVGGVRLVLLPASTTSQLGRLTLALVAVLHLGALAVHPAGSPILDAAMGLERYLLPLLLLAALAVIAVGCGLRPAAGADLTALGILVLNVTLGFLDTPCGLRTGAATAVAVTFLGVLAFTRALSGLLPGWRPSS